MRGVQLAFSKITFCAYMLMAKWDVFEWLRLRTYYWEKMTILWDRDLYWPDIYLTIVFISLLLLFALELEVYKVYKMFFKEIFKKVFRH